MKTKKNNQTVLPELLIPSGSISKLKMAIAYGADAVYVGAQGMSMRPDEAAFDIPSLAEAVEYTHLMHKKIYVAINTLMFQDDMLMIEQWIKDTCDISFDAVIVADAGVFSLVKQLRPELKIHISTQMSVANLQSAQFWMNAGADRIVLARECSLANAKEIGEKSNIDIELFIHGAMCVAVSGRCLLSAHLCGKSGSKGICKHSCRWEWQLVEKRRPGMTMPVFETGRKTIFLGSKDLCMLEHIPELINTHARSLKVEGRMKGEYYTAAVTRVYRAALDRYALNPAEYTVDQAWIDELEAVSHRPYTTGFAFGYPENNPDTLQASNRPESSHETLGFVTDISDNVYSISVKNTFAVGEEIEWIAPSMQGGSTTATSIIDQKGRSNLKTHCGTTAMINFTNGNAPTINAILRRKRNLQQNNSSPNKVRLNRQ